MKFIKKLTPFVKRLPKQTIFTLLAIGLVSVAVPANMTKAEYYPARTPFDYNKPCNPNDADIYDRCGSLAGPVFNSFINTPSYGDERAFLDARRSDQTAAGSFQNVLPDVTGGSREVVVRMYIHNNANQDTNASGLGIARNTRVRIGLPTGTSQTLRARGYISADNAALVEDTVDFVGNEQFNVAFVPGSATMYTLANPVGVQLDNSIVAGGVNIGNVNGCFDYEAVVQIRLRVTPVAAPNPDLNIVKQVRRHGDTAWVKEVNARPNEQVDWLITVDNTGQANVNGVVTRDVLPPHVRLVPGTVRWITASQNATQSDGPLFGGGINVGNYAPGGGFYVTFTTTVLGDFEPCQVRVRNVAFAKSGTTPEIQDDADVVITRENCQPDTPLYRCDLLTVTSLGNRAYRYEVRHTEQNATLRTYTYDFGDGQTQVTDRNPVEHTYAREGNYVARVTLTYQVNGQNQTTTSDACAKPITIGTPPNQPPRTPRELPRTGPADVVSLFAATSAVGTVAHSVVSRRRR